MLPLSRQSSNHHGRSATLPNNATVLPDQWKQFEALLNHLNLKGAEFRRHLPGLQRLCNQAVIARYQQVVTISRSVEHLLPLNLLKSKNATAAKGDASCFRSA
jgi:hypothetical protein